MAIYYQIPVDIKIFMDNNMSMSNNNDYVTKKGLINELANFFEQVLAPYLDEKFGEIDKHFKKIDDHLDEIDDHLDQHDRRFDKFDDRLDRHGKMLDEHEKKITDLQRATLN